MHVRIEPIKVPVRMFRYQWRRLEHILDRHVAALDLTPQRDERRQRDGR